MSTELNGRRIAFLTAPSGVEQVELTSPWNAVRHAGGIPQLVSSATEAVRAFTHDVEKGQSFPVDVSLAVANPSEFDALVLPGGTKNSDSLRLSPDAMTFVAAFAAQHRPIAAICHGPWSLVESDLVRGKTLTSWPSLATDIRNAGGMWVDEEVHVCDAGGWTLVTSRRPDDLPVFNREIVKAFSQV